MIVKSRMAKVEGKLTPQQVVLSLLAGIMRGFDSFLEWAEWVRDQPGCEAPLNKVTKAVLEAVRTAMKGRPREAIYAAQEQALREAHFLVRLFLRVQEMLQDQMSCLRDGAANCVLRMRLRHLHAVIDGDVREAIIFLHREPKPTSERLDGIGVLSRRLSEYFLDGLSDSVPQQHEKEAADDSDDDPGGQTANSWFRMMTDVDEIRDCLVDHLSRAYLAREMVQTIRRTYFAGQAVLFREDANRLEETVKAAEKLAGLHNGMVWCYASSPKSDSGPGESGSWNDEPPHERLIDLEATKANVAADVRRNVAFDVCMAKAETLIGLGDNEDGYRLARKGFLKRYGARQP